ncbi:DUF2937 family protein [Pseudomonas sp. EpS/L25]|uniref:DUF2937 family protein n=1 Tax=Pseudomonas sp. EpS/L25 TaxID=1749078 RepID=UPI0007432E31|nr:DUF2937 family protein [Pseudomonas sp. EpS/L25]KUM44356.1 hypothetical protein AR540_21610 [Pseudomonas sp. EpS/L25]
MLRSYIRMLLFSLALLVGVQVPGFMLDYEQRVDAHRLESEQSLGGFRRTADQYFEGSLERLLAHYQASEDPVFRSDADSLGILMRRNALFNEEWQALQGPWYEKAWRILVRPNPELRDETLAQYRYQVVLTPAAIAWGVGLGLALAVIMETLALWLSILLYPRRPARRIS